MNRATSSPGAVRLVARTFTERDQAIFARASGDCNPIHVDARAARRTQAGAPIVHGMHLLLWLLNGIRARFPNLPPIAAVKAQFKKPIYAGDKVEAVVTGKTRSSITVEALTSDGTALTLRITLGKTALPPPPFIPVEPGQIQEIPSTPLEPSWEELAGMSGRLAFTAGAPKLNRLFPHLFRFWGADRIAAVGCTSALVGMVIPGLHSLVMALDFKVTAAPVLGRWLDFKVASVDPRFRLVRHEFCGGGLFGSLECRQIPAPIAQATMATVAAQVAPDAFAGTSTLVIGGSRGLGELTAKIIAAGGGKVVLTYAQGRAEAERVRAEITAWGGTCVLACYDVLKNPARQLKSFPEVPGHLYYFATPSIFGRKSRAFHPGRLDLFNSFYIAGFNRLIQAALRWHPDGVRAFYPSSVAVSERVPGLTEYAMAKAAGEILCADLAASTGGKVHVTVARLPRLLTDQTATVWDLSTEDSIAVLLPLIHQVQGRTPKR